MITIILAHIIVQYNNFYKSPKNTESMKAHKIQRSSGAAHDVHIQEDLYIPELEVSFYARTENLMSKPIFGKVTHQEMSVGMRDDLIRVSQGITSNNQYNVHNKGEIDLSESDIRRLEEKLAEYNALNPKLKAITNGLFEAITNGSFVPLVRLDQ